MSIYIANGTKQTLRHFFRQPGSPRAVFVEIPSGRQAEICKGASFEDISKITEHMQKYGFRDAKDSTIKPGEVSGIVFRVGKPVTSDTIEAEHAALVDTQERRSAAEATKSALGFDSSTRDPKDKKSRRAKVTAVTVEQEHGPRSQPTGDEVHFSVEVTPEGSDKAPLPV